MVRVRRRRAARGGSACGRAAECWFTRDVDAVPATSNGFTATRGSHATKQLARMAQWLRVPAEARFLNTPSEPTTPHDVRGQPHSWRVMVNTPLMQENQSPTTPRLTAPCTYQGGKQRYARQIVDHIFEQGTIDTEATFYDVCCGSGAISVELINRGVAPERITMLDISTWGAFWNALGRGEFGSSDIRWGGHGVSPPAVRSMRRR